MLHTTIHLIPTDSVAYRTHRSRLSVQSFGMKNCATGVQGMTSARQSTKEGVRMIKIIGLSVLTIAMFTIGYICGRIEGRDDV